MSPNQVIALMIASAPLGLGCGLLGLSRGWRFREVLVLQLTILCGALCVRLWPL